MQYDEKCDTVYEDKCSTQYITVNEEVKVVRLNPLIIRNWNSKVFLTWPGATVQHVKIFQVCNTVYDTQCKTVEDEKCEIRYEDKCEQKYEVSSIITTQYIIMEPNTLLILIIICLSVIGQCF